MGKLSTHVLDTVNGRPAAGLRIRLGRLEDGTYKTICELATNADGRTDGPLLEGEALVEGEYEIVFDVGGYFGTDVFLSEVPVRFRIADPTASYHVPLLCSPWAYQTYRGS